MAKFKVINNEKKNTVINPLLIENEFPNSTNLFNIGSFTITTNATNSVSVLNSEFQNKLTAFSAPVTLETLKLTDLTKLSTFSDISSTIILNFDKKNLNNYALFGSLHDRIVASINNIINNWVGSLFITNTDTSGNFYYNIQNYTFDSLKNQSTFNIPSFLIQNNFELIYTTNSQQVTSSQDIKNLNYSYNKYVLFNLSDQKEYIILNFIGSYQNNNGFINITVDGNPFPIAATAGTDSSLFHLKPNNIEFTYFYNNLDSFEKYILSEDSDPLYTMTVKVPVVNDDDQFYFQEKKYTFPVNDGYNIDITSNNFKSYFNSLLTLAEAYDNFKSDIIYRMFLPASVRNSDITDNMKSLQFCRILGRELDEIKSFIDGLVYINNVSYNKVDNVPDKLVKNLAQTLGWENFNIIETDDLFASIFNNVTENTINQFTPQEIDIELWRRILINTSWLFKSKGTRKAIEAIFSFMGLPNCFIEINEHVYTVSGKINPNAVDLNTIFPLNLQLNKLPYDNNGFPVASSEITDFYFQKAGNNDSGQEYINIYRTLGFNVQKTIDNRKSWVYSQSAETRFDDFTEIETNYTSLDSRLIINTKELSLNIDPIKAIECDVYGYNFNYNYSVSSTGRTIPYPQRTSNIFAVSGLTFVEYINEVYSTFVNAQNRKVADDGNGGGYPSLTKLYYDYLYRSLTENGIQSNAYDLRKIFNYIKKFQNSINKFFVQLAPATVILDQQGIKIRNTIFTPQKFVYKHGIDDSSEFETLQPQNISDTLGGVSLSQSNIILPIETDINIWESSGTYTFSSNGDSGNPTDTLLLINQTLSKRDIWESEVFTFDIPQYIMTGTTKILSGVTQSAVYYYDETTSGKTIYFDFTANTTCLSATTDPCQFIYKIYKYDSTITGFSINPILTTIVPYSTFSGGSSTFNDIINKSNLNPDSEYLIKGYSKELFEVPTANTINFPSVLDSYGIFDKYIYPVSGPSYDFFFDYSKYSGYTGTVISTESVITGSTWNIYDPTLDWYFVSVGDPQTPTLINLDQNTTTTPTLPFFVYEQVIPNGSNDVTLTYFPVGDIQLAVNGSSLLKNTEYIEKQNLISSLQGRIYTLLVPFSATTTDVVTVAYLAQGNSYNIANDYSLINYISSGSTEIPPYKVLFNTSTLNYEYYLTQCASGTSNNIQVSWNGQLLTPVTDYNLSISNNRRIVFNNITLHTGDTISVYYTTGNTITIPTFIIPSNPYTFQWTIPNPIPNNQIGNFILEFSNLNDVNFTGVTISASTPYINNQTIFSLTVDFTQSPYNGLIGGNIYNVRIESDKFYTGITTDVYETKRYSSSFQVKIPT